MVIPSSFSEENTARNLALAPDDANTSGVSWGAIIAGAAGAASLSLILLMLGFGLGLSAVSPWSNSGATARAIGVSTIVWLAFTQIAASGLGGYLAGRLRVKWANVHTDEVYFRDTAHGFLAWAIATLTTAALLTTAAAGAASGGVRAGAAVAQGAATTVGAVAKSAPSSADSISYFVDTLFRPAPSAQPTASAPVAQTADNSSRAEVVKIFANDLHTGQLTSQDQQYVGQVIAAQTGLSQADAEARVADTYARVSKTITDSETAVRQAADNARKAAAHSSLWMFISLLCGAFFASLTALYGGKRRDLVVRV